MDTAPGDILSRHSVPRHRLTLDDYHRLGEARILGEDDRVELLEGQLVDMSPIGPRHALAVDALNESLIKAVAGRAWVRVQNPIELGDGTEPQPDFALVRRPWRGYPGAHPRPEDIFLLVEVADTSLETDRGAKLELYARAGIREFWIVDLTTDGVLVQRNPSGNRYESVTRVEPSGILEVKDLPGVMIPAASLFA
ncbi:MAG TPA: Uma2 family endonuclease [Acetobacteraceae bacterium]|nr:Uma2 family endonuclease [Acetobacteraceae bacterium]